MGILFYVTFTPTQNLRVNIGTLLGGKVLWPSCFRHLKLQDKVFEGSHMSYGLILGWGGPIHGHIGFGGTY